MKQQYRYGDKPAEVRPAAGVKGMLIRSFNGEILFRVYHNDNRDHFTDYAIRHDDLQVTIAEDEQAAFYTIGQDNIIDHSPEVLGFEKQTNRKST
jgi:hypothetical protein